MSLVAASQPAPGQRPGKQNRPYFGLWGSPVTPSVNLRTGTRPFSSQRPARAENRDLGTAYMPKVAEWPLLPTSCFLLLPPCFPGFRAGVGEAKNGPEGPF